jgi:glycosyltransferase involved in cell wall biosynthesis
VDDRPAAPGGDRPPCVLHLIPTLGPGGAERQVTYLAAGLVGLGWEVHVGYYKEGPNLARLARSGAVLHRVASCGSYDPTILLRLLRLVRAVRPHLVQTWLPAMDILGGFVARLQGVPWVMTERSSPGAYDPSLKLWSQAFVSRYARAIIANSNGGASYWAARLRSKVPCHVVPNGLPLGEIAAAEAPPDGELGVPADVPLVLFVGRLDSGKNIDVLLGALERTILQAPAVGLIAGDGPMRADVESFVEERGLEGSLVVPGIVSEVWPWLRRARVFVSLSLYEGMPNAVMEAMAAGCPLVLSDTATHREIIPDDCALYVPPDSAAAASAAILASLRDPASAAGRAARARTHARRWSIDEVARRYDEVYRGLLGWPDVARAGDTQPLTGVGS